MGLLLFSVITIVLLLIVITVVIVTAIAYTKGSEKYDIKVPYNSTVEYNVSSLLFQSITVMTNDELKGKPLLLSLESRKQLQHKHHTFRDVIHKNPRFEIARYWPQGGNYSISLSPNDDIYYMYHWKKITDAYDPDDDSQKYRDCNITNVSCLTGKRGDNNIIIFSFNDISNDAENITIIFNETLKQPDKFDVQLTEDVTSYEFRFNDIFTELFFHDAGHSILYASYTVRPRPSNGEIDFIELTITRSPRCEIWQLGIGISAIVVVLLIWVATVYYCRRKYTPIKSKMKL